MPRVFRLSIMGLLALALSGCFVSKTALIQPDQAAPIFDGKTGYSRSSLGDDGQTWVEDEKGSISKVDGGYVARSNEEKDDAPITLRRAFGDFYVTQQAGSDEFYYDLARIEGDRLYLYHFTCGDEDQRHVNAGVIDSLSGRGDDLRCNVSDFGKLIQVFKARLDAGALPKSLYVIK
jgi:hypothetical protein